MRVDEIRLHKKPPQLLPRYWIALERKENGSAHKSHTRKNTHLIFLHEAKASLDAIPNKLLNLNPSFESFFSSILPSDSEFIDLNATFIGCRGKGFALNI